MGKSIYSTLYHLLTNYISHVLKIMDTVWEVLQNCFYKRFSIQNCTLHFHCIMQTIGLKSPWKMRNLKSPPFVWLSSENAFLSLKSTGTDFLVRFEVLIFISQASRFVMLLLCLVCFCVGEKSYKKNHVGFHLRTAYHFSIINIMLQLQISYEYSFTATTTLYWIPLFRQWPNA